MMNTFTRVSTVVGYLAFFLAIACSIGALSSGPGVRFDIWQFQVGIKLLKWSIYGAILTTGLALLHGFFHKVAGKNFFNRRAILSFILGSVTFLIPYAYIQQFEQYDTIADATSDFEDPPVFVSIAPIRNTTARNPLEYRGEEAAEQQQLFFPELTGLKINADVEHIVAVATEVLKDMDLEIIAVAPEEGRLEATDTTFWFGYKDDLVIRIRTLEDGLSHIDARSASRVGYGDGGVNAIRVKTFLAKLNQKLSS